jgi:hypothetical protein
MSIGMLSSHPRAAPPNHRSALGHEAFNKFGAVSVAGRGTTTRRAVANLRGDARSRRNGEASFGSAPLADGGSVGKLMLAAATSRHRRVRARACGPSHSGCSRVRRPNVTLRACRHLTFLNLLQPECHPGRHRSRWRNTCRSTKRLSIFANIEAETPAKMSPFITLNRRHAHDSTTRPLNVRASAGCSDHARMLAVDGVLPCSADVASAAFRECCAA